MTKVSLRQKQNAIAKPSDYYEILVQIRFWALMCAIFWWICFPAAFCFQIILLIKTIKLFCLKTENSWILKTRKQDYLLISIFSIFLIGIILSIIVIKFTNQDLKNPVFLNLEYKE